MINTPEKETALLAYVAYCAADEAWGEAIEREFPGEHPGDVRYTDRAHGVPGSELRRLYDDYVAKREPMEVAYRVLFPPLTF